ncbi:ATP-dependent RNA helicase [Podosphaera aphanis]|nr:ATP-dependent RNA helicase [Podosphaera aphanis]
MVTSSKRRTEDDFILTISDNGEDFPEEVSTSPNPSKKRRLNSNSSKKSKGTKITGKGTEEKDDSIGSDEVNIWGAKDEDDGAMDSEFEFQMEDGKHETLKDFEGWGFESAKIGLGSSGKSEKKTVDIDNIIARRREERNKVGMKEPDESDSEESVQALQIDEGDEYLTGDGFGMGVGSDKENSANEEETESENEGVEGEISDNESVASPAPHPDDLDTEDEDTDGSENGENLEEAARRKAFFAPEEKSLPNAKTDVRTTFQSMSLSRPILRGLAAVGFSQPTPIQAKTIPVALLGKDIVGGAVTGSGKTAAFIVPILERLFYRPKKIPTTRVAILMPTRELAIQCHAVATKIASHTDIKFCLAVGGLNLKAQEVELRLRPDVIIATPGRFIDHMRNSVSFTVDTLEILVLDEADRMLEAGFSDELNEIVATIPKSRQTMLFSATMNSSVDNLIRVGLNKPARILVDSQKQTVATLTQEFIRLRPGRETKRAGYLLYLCKNVYTNRVIVFFRQKKEAHRVRIIFGLLGLKAAELHGSMSQEQRIASIEAFRDGKVDFLLATDLASRGLDIKGVDTVINYEAPQSHEIYLHRVGRTARAGRQGRACTLAAEPDRKVIKAAVKSGRSQGAKILSRVIEVSDADKWAEKVEKMQEEIDEILKEEKEEKQLAQAEMQVRRGENIIVHEDEIKARPKRTWFESEEQKRAAKQAGREELNGVPAKKVGKLSNKRKKTLDDKNDRQEGKIWKKGRAEREGKGALAAKKSSKVKSDKPRHKTRKPGKKG